MFKFLEEWDLLLKAALLIFFKIVETDLFDGDELAKLIHTFEYFTV